MEGIRRGKKSTGEPKIDAHWPEIARPLLGIE
jgi:hypothetical protein